MELANNYSPVSRLIGMARFMVYHCYMARLNNIIDPSEKSESQKTVLKVLNLNTRPILLADVIMKNEHATLMRDEYSLKVQPLQGWDFDFISFPPVSPVVIQISSLRDN